MAQHVGMDLERETGRLGGPGNELLKPRNGEWRAALGDKHERRSLGLTLQPTEGPQLAPADRMRRGGPFLASIHVQAGSLELNLLPAQIHELGRAQAVLEGSQDHGRIAMAVAGSSWLPPRAVRPPPRSDAHGFCIRYWGVRRGPTVRFSVSGATSLRCALVKEFPDFYAGTVGITALIWTVQPYTLSPNR